MIKFFNEYKKLFEGKIPDVNIKEEDLIVEIVEMGSTGNLNVNWKLRQIMGITVRLRH